MLGIVHCAKTVSCGFSFLFVSLVSNFAFLFFPSPLSLLALDVLMADRRIPDFAKTLTVSTPPFPWNFPGRVGQQ